jgi:membrane AbrB-like protein
MLGAMTATILAALMRLPLETVGWVRSPATGVIGAMLGSNITHDVLLRLWQFVPSIAALALFMALCAIQNAYYFRRVGGLDGNTAFLAGMPSGLIEMVLLGRKVGADTETIALVHGSRIFMVTMLLSLGFQLATGTRLDATARASSPAAGLHGFSDIALLAGVVVAGLVLGRLGRFPAPALTGPLVASAVLHASGLGAVVFPGVVVILAQLLLGTIIGSGFVRYPPRHVMRVLMLSAGSTVILLVQTVIVGVAVAAMVGADARAMILAFSPGGLTEMSLVAYALHTDVAAVSVHHIARFAMVAGLGQAGFRIFRRLVPPPPPDTGESERK